jgi:amino acid transporter
MIDEAGAGAPQLRRSLTLWNLVIIGIVLIQPIAPMGIYGVVNNAARGHVVTTILIAMVAMLLTAISYGMLARIYPSAGSAYTYVGQELHTSLGFLTGWAMLMDYILNPLICIILCSKLTQNILPEVPYWMLAIFYATAFTLLNLRGVKTSARINEVMAGAMTIVVIVFFAYVIRFLIQLHSVGPHFFSKPFYDPETFHFGLIIHGTSIAVLTYIGFDALSVKDTGRMIDEVARRFGRLDILVNTVGGQREEKADDVTEENFDYVIDLNLKAVMFQAQAAAKHMIAGKQGGKQVHFGSVRSQLALRGRG